jgi:hypothetical protein
LLSNQEKRAIQEQIKSNKHEAIVISVKVMDKIMMSSKKEGIKEKWETIRGKTLFGATWSATADDVRTASKLIGDLGGIGVKAYVRNYRGKSHIVLKGYPGLRRILTGTKYGVFNPKVVTMGLGKAGAVHAARAGGILSVVLMTSYRVIDCFLTDRLTLTHLVGSLATDIVKIGIATGASIAAVHASIGFGLTLAVGPIIVVVIIGAGTSMALTALDNKYNITSRVVEGLDDLVKITGSNVKKIQKKTQNSIDKTVNSSIDFIVDSVTTIVINTAKHHLDRFLSNHPRLY